MMAFPLTDFRLGEKPPSNREKVRTSSVRFDIASCSELNSARPPCEQGGTRFMISHTMTTHGGHESWTIFGGREFETAIISRVCQVSFPYCTNTYHWRKMRSDFRMIKAQNSHGPGPSFENSIKFGFAQGLQPTSRAPITPQSALSGWFPGKHGESDRSR